MTVSIRLSESENNLIKKYADMNGLPISAMIRKIVVEHIEDEFDLATYYKAMKEHEANPITYTLEEVKRRVLDECDD